jgi:hypothetical protein
LNLHSLAHALQWQDAQQAQQAWYKRLFACFTLIFELQI